MDDDNKDYDIIDNKEINNEVDEDSNMVIIQDSQNNDQNIFKQVCSYLSDITTDKSFSIASEDQDDINTEEEYGEINNEINNEVNIINDENKITTLIDDMEIDNEINDNNNINYSL